MVGYDEKAPPFDWKCEMAGYTEFTVPLVTTQLKSIRNFSHQLKFGFKRPFVT